MIKPSFIYLALSLFVVLVAPYIHVVVVYLDILYTKSNILLVPFFSDNNAGHLLMGVIVLTLLPICITAIPALIYRALQGKLIPYYYEATWFVWLVIVVSKIVIA